MEKLRVYCGGTLFSCSFWSSVLTKKKKKSCNPSDYIEWANRAVLCNCRCCHPPPELPLELLLWTLRLCWFLSFFTLLYICLFLQTLFTSFPLTDYCFPCLCSFTSPSTPNCCVCSWTFLSLACFLPRFLLSFPFLIWLLFPSVAECIPPPQRKSLPAAWSHGPHHGSLQCHHGVIHRGLRAAGWSCSCFGGVRYRNYCQRRGALTWTEFVQNKESGENSPDKLKPPSSLCKQRCFFRSPDNIWTACHKGSKRHCCLR